jgi:hypothetical protein
MNTDVPKPPKIITLEEHKRELTAKFTKGYDEGLAKGTARERDRFKEYLTKHNNCGPNGCTVDGRQEQDGVPCNLVVYEEIAKELGS